MPTYEYACRSCDHNFDIVQSFSEDTLTTCPECGRDELRKVYNAAGIIFKGDGWHIKDYASKGGGKGSTTSDGAGTDSSTTTDASDAGASKDAGSTKDSGSSSDSGSSGATKAAS